jgi:hypothetical protein
VIADTDAKLHGFPAPLGKDGAVSRRTGILSPASAVLLVTIVVPVLSSCTSTATSNSPTPTSSAAPSGQGAENFQLRPVLDESRGPTVRCPAQIETTPATSQPFVACSIDRRVRFELGPAVTTGRDVVTATTQPAASGPQWVVALTLTPAGTSTVLAATTAASELASPRNSLALLVDGVVVSAPHFDAPVSGGGIEVTGPFTQQQAQILASRIAPSR